MKHSDVEMNRLPYSSDLPPETFFSFFLGVEDIKNNVTTDFKGVSSGTFANSFKKNYNDA